MYPAQSLSTPQGGQQQQQQEAFPPPPPPPGETPVDTLTFTGRPDSLETDRVEDPTFRLVVPRGFFERVKLMIG